jgi:hypothetical protein
MQRAPAQAPGNAADRALHTTSGGGLARFGRPASKQAGPVRRTWCLRTLSWERTRTFQRLRSTLREYFPAALDAYAELTLTSTDALELLIKAPTPAPAAKLTRSQITAVLARSRRRNRDEKAAATQAALREPQLGLPGPVTAAYAAAVAAHARVRSR